MSTLIFMNNAKKAKVIEAAQGVFFRYGYRRVTMGDLAGAAGISRPALYLLFCNKEEVFQATLRAFTARALREVHEGLPAQATAKDKLTYAFEVWAIKPYVLLMASPDAKELIDGTFTFAKDALGQGHAAFEAELAAILTPLGAKDPGQTARLLAGAVRGFKEAARNLEDLRAMIMGMVDLTLTSLGHP